MADGIDFYLRDLADQGEGQPAPMKRPAAAKSDEDSDDCHDDPDAHVATKRPASAGPVGKSYKAWSSYTCVHT